MATHHPLNETNAALPLTKLPNFRSLLIDDQDPTCYSTDMFQSLGIPSSGIKITLNLYQAALINPKMNIIFSDAAQWQLNLGQHLVCQEAYAHAGFKGSLTDLLSKLSKDIDMMKSGYDPSTQGKMETFLDEVNHIHDELINSSFKLTTNETKISQTFKNLSLLIIDPSGLAFIEDESCFISESFERSWKHVKDLDIIPNRVNRIQISDIASFQKLIDSCSKIVALTGAGISVESGIPPFRSLGTHINHDAIWNNFDPNKLTLHNFYHDPDIANQWWQLKNSLIDKPNAAHQFFLELHVRHKLLKVITQNIDSLHHDSGLPDDKVIELHGNMRGAICSDHKTIFNQLPINDGQCDYQTSNLDKILDEFKLSKKLPKCPKCNRLMRLNTTMFGQPIDLSLITSARQAVTQADLLIIIGTSLIVEPANDLPWIAMRQGTPIVMINLDNTEYDEYVNGLFKESAGDFVQKVELTEFNMPA